MTDTSMRPKTTQLPGAEILMRLRRLIIVGLLAAIGSWFLISGSKGQCGGSIDADGGYLDAAGQPALDEPLCATLNLRPNGVMPVVIAVVVLWVLGRIIRSAAGEAEAIRTIDRTAAVIAIVAAAGIVISYMWFALTPIPEPGSSFTIFSPFPFATIDVDVSPMSS
ncbi:hypothetical protein [Microbacterium sp. NPDC056234]|uniref:hypothetical protein n=1 Tax=Microbacterium sp. NPDC056234 TaxID=3345757 RepID=UPI0035E1BB55